jgi:hypothetical protein
MVKVPFLVGIREVNEPHVRDQSELYSRVSR